MTYSSQDIQDARLLFSIINPIYSQGTSPSGDMCLFNPEFTVSVLNALKPQTVSSIFSTTSADSLLMIPSKSTSTFEQNMPYLFIPSQLPNVQCGKRNGSIKRI